ncbi:DHA1 family bicyclomycin/chloramphenicol resistance-like MFS transporter [Variovorax paradoxus]|uniref:Bcr/CflA family efflux transporter n=1 Tax=Variovorax paradoxus TaxID=34073 RepID=A0AAE3XWJ6_VARPD|nr:MULTISPECIES: multidrug effflux MFS transporter [Variovorax]MBD9664516.1 multidrug effflux MFS transporter [Variovorax sp. VRV01]MDR6425160.1 DHA1 family bicyclomycin/chloramphenicol resistance-like MFS transporter [Variovorax paradoxus]
MSSSNAQLSRYAVVLGLLTAIGPSAIDMYLPALPAIGHALGADPHAVQASLMAFFIASGAGQLVAGPLSDMFGRKRPMYAGLAVFVAASIGCALAPSIGVLIAFRFLQGLGACASMVTPRAVVRDLHAGTEAARLMSLLILVYSVSPILAPLVGSFVAEMASWRAVFWVIGVLAVLAAAMVAVLLPETRPPAARAQSSLRAAMAAYGALLRDRHFLAVASMASITLSGFFVYVANSSFVMGTHYGISPRTYAVLFSLNAVSMIAVSQANGRLAARFGIRRVLRTAVVAHAAVAGLLLALTLSGVDRLGALVGLLMVVYGLNGVIVPSAFVVAMEGHAARAGTASALLGTLNFAGGAVVVALVSPFANGTPLPMVAGIACCSAVVLVLALRTLGRPRAAAMAGA